MGIKRGGPKVFIETRVKINYRNLLNRNCYGILGHIAIFCEDFVKRVYKWYYRNYPLHDLFIVTISNDNLGFRFKETKSVNVATNNRQQNYGQRFSSTFKCCF